MVASHDAHFERIWAEIRDLRAETRQLRAETRTEIRDLRVEMHEMRAEMHTGFEAIRRDMFHGAIALFGSQAALFAVLVVHAL